MKIIQPPGTRGSLKWIQKAVNDDWVSLNDSIRQNIGRDSEIRWLSPLQKDDYAEYRDADFLKLLDLGHLTDALKSFWPLRGPQWDALARTNRGDILLIEAKSHVGEMCSTPCGASGPSLRRIEANLNETARMLGAPEGRAPWSQFFYQLANRISHLHWLRNQGVQAWLVLVNFINDEEMGGPSTPEAWCAAYEVAFHVMGLPKRHLLSPFIIEVYPDVARATAG